MPSGVTGRRLRRLPLLLLLLAPVVGNLQAAEVPLQRTIAAEQQQQRQRGRHRGDAQLGPARPATRQGQQGGSQQGRGAAFHGGSVSPIAGATAR